MMDIVEDLEHKIEVYMQFNDDHSAGLVNTLVMARDEIVELREKLLTSK